MTVETSAPTPAKEEKIKVARMPFGRWMRIVGWRHIVAIIMVIWALFPALYVINLAFSGSNSLNAACPPDRTGVAALLCLVPNNLSLDNFTAILTSSQWPFAVWFRNTVILATLNSFLALLMGAAAAFAFSRLRFKGRRMGLLTLMLVQMFPAVLALTAIFILLQAIGDVFPAFGLRSIWGLLLVYLGGALGVNTFLMKGFFDTIPVDIDESARIDGAGHVKIFFGLIMRLALPILVVVFFVSFTATFNELPMAGQILPDPDNTTLAVGLRSLVVDPLRQQWGLMAAGGLLAAIPMLIVFAVTQRSLTTGLTAGAVKG